MTVFAGFGLTLATIGAAYTVFATHQVNRRIGRPVSAGPATYLPSVTLVKPLHGAEPELYANLESFCQQDYAGEVQLVFGVHDIADPAVAVVRDLQRAYPAHDISLVADGRVHGENGKVCNLINMQREIRGEIVVLSDSDILVGPSYIKDVVAPFSQAAVGFVTCLYTGRSTGTTWARLAAMGINYQFLPNVVAGVSLGLATPCLGATVALKRVVLEEIGGFSILVDQLADDYDLGRAVRELGYVGAIAATPVVHLCAERSWRELWSHEARWNRTIRIIDPAGFFGAGVTYALPWALIGLCLDPGPIAFAVLAAALGARLHLVRQLDRAIGQSAGGMLLLPIRDMLSFVVFLNAFLGKTVSWRGRRFSVGADGALTPAQESLDAHPVSASPFLRRFRRGRRIALPGEARDQIVLVPDLARSAGGHGREQPSDRRPAA
jgi:ceramide glucosyltransferase